VIGSKIIIDELSWVRINRELYEFHELLNIIPPLPAKGDNFRLHHVYVKPFKVNQTEGKTPISRQTA